MIRREDDGVWVILDETIAAHHDDVFDCLTSADGLTRWLSVGAKVDLRQGGSIVFGWDAQFTKTTTIAILDYDAGGKIVWDWYAASDDTHAPVYWTVKATMDKGSIVTMRQGPFKEDVESLIAMADEAESWRWYLCNLRGVLEMKHDMRKVRPL